MNMSLFENMTGGQLVFFIVMIAMIGTLVLILVLRGAPPENDDDKLRSMFNAHASRRLREMREAVDAARATLSPIDEAYACLVFEMNEPDDDPSTSKSRLVVKRIDTNEGSYPPGWRMLFLVRVQWTLGYKSADFKLARVEIVDARGRVPTPPVEL